MNVLINALINDIAQRVLTLNKLEQKAHMSNLLDGLVLKDGASVLDFGCGTGLFAPVFYKRGLKYCGYDIDEGLVRYGQVLYGRKGCEFSKSINALNDGKPFDLIIANCCFHHIDDASALDIIMDLRTRVNDDGMFLLIDILFPHSDPSVLRGLFRRLERGAYIRTKEQYVGLVEKGFCIMKSYITRSHLMSIRGAPIYNDLLVLVCSKMK